MKTPDPGAIANPHTPALAGPAQIATSHNPGPAARAPQGQAAPPTTSEFPTALDLLLAFRHRWKLALGLGLLCGVVAVAGTWKLLPPPDYSAHALIRVAAKPPKIIFDTEEVLPSLRDYQSTQLTLLKSRAVLNRALSDDAVRGLDIDREYTDPVRYLEENIQASFKGEILRISMQSSRREETSVLVNAVTEAFFTEVVNKEMRDRRERYRTLEDLYKDYQVTLTDKRKDLKQLADALGSFDRDTATYQLQLAHQRHAAARQELLGIEGELRKVDAQLAVIEQTPSGDPPDGISLSEVDILVRQDSGMQQYAARIAELQSRLRSYQRVTPNPSDPAVRRLSEDLTRFRRQQQDYEARLRVQITQNAHAEQIGVSGLRLLQEQKRILEERRKLAEREVKAFQQETRQTNREVWTLQEVQDEITYIDAAARKVGGEIEALKVELDAPERVTLLQAAEDPRLQPDGRPKKAGMAGVAAFGIVALGISLLEFRSRRIRSTDVVVQDLGLSLVGALPPLPQARGRVLGRRSSGEASRDVEARQRSVLLESVDSMRTLLLRLAAVESVRAVMITSAVEGEGKTSLACHLATSLARAGRQTLLVDCDLRKPSVHKLFDVPGSPGLAEVLLGEAGPGDAIRLSGIDGLAILPAGRPNPAAIQALAFPETRDLFDRLKERYDFVVVDTAPVLPVADTLLVGQYIDGVIYSVLRDVSRIPKVQAARERLRSLGVRVLGAVMTGVDSELYGSDYYYAASASEA